MAAIIAKGFLHLSYIFFAEGSIKTNCNSSTPLELLEQLLRAIKAELVKLCHFLMHRAPRFVCVGRNLEQPRVLYL